MDKKSWVSGPPQVSGVAFGPLGALLVYLDWGLRACHYPSKGYSGQKPKAWGVCIQMWMLLLLT